MATLLMTQSTHAKKGVKKKTLAQRVTVGANTLVIIVITLICVVSISYLLHSNKSAAKGYDLKLLQEESNFLEQEVSFWDLKISQAKSLNSLTNTPLASDMRAAKSMEFVRGDTAVALRQ